MSTIDAIKFELKNGCEFIIRSGDESDANQLIQLACILVEDGEGQVIIPGELDLTYENEIKWINNHRNNPANLLLVVELNGELIALLDFYGTKTKRLAHTGSFGMGVKKEYRSWGVGKALLQTLLTWARSHPQLEKINIDVLSTNANAISLYKLNGFIEIGRQHKQVKYSDERYVDNVLMEILL